MRTLALAFLLLAAMALGALPASANPWALGNDDILRAMTDNAVDFTVLDLAPLDYTIPEPGMATTWHWHTQDQTYWGHNVSPVQQMDLMLWRPMGGTSYLLMYKQQVTSGPNFGAHSAPVTNPVLVVPGDVLGYYVPTGQSAILSLDYPGAGFDPYILNSGELVVGQTYDFTASNGKRTYSMYVDVCAPVPEPITMLLGALGLASVSGLRRIRR